MGSLISVLPRGRRSGHRSSSELYRKGRYRDIVMRPRFSNSSSPQLLRVDHLPGHAAVHDEVPAGYEAAHGPDKEGCQFRYVLNAADAAGRMERVLFLRWFRPLGQNPARAD